MKRTSVAAILVFILAAGQTAALAAAGDLDATFGTSGKVTTSFGAYADVGTSVAIQADQKIVVAGDTNATGDDFQGDFALARYDTDGTLDKTFGVSGKVATSFGSGWDRAEAVVIQADQKIVAGGRWDEGATSHNDFALARYDTDGTLDKTFGVSGKVMTPVSTGTDELLGLAVQTDQKIVAVGRASDGNGSDDFALARYNTDGTLDTSFGATGIVTTDIDGRDGARGVAIQADGKIVVAGAATGTAFGSTTNFAVARYNADGTLDASFGSGGKVVTSASGNSDGTSAGVVIQADGKIIAAGVAGMWNFGVVRYNTDGTLDTSFGTGGIAQTRIGDSAWSLGVALQPTDGRIVVAGRTTTGSVKQFAVARYMPNGRLDPGFGSGGTVVTPFGSTDDSAGGVVLQADGGVVVAGHTDVGSYDYDFAVARYDAGTPATNTALTIAAPRKVRVGTKATISGALSSADTACSSAQSVVLHKGSTTVGTKLTDVTGAYKFTLRIKKKTTLWVTFDGTGACNPSASDKKVIKAT